MFTLSKVSDDEDDTHPNIDTPSLFRWRHQARIERDLAWKNEKDDFEAGYKKFLNNKNECLQKLKKAKEGNDAVAIVELEEKIKQFEIEAKEWLVKESSIKKKERVCSYFILTCIYIVKAVEY